MNSFNENCAVGIEPNVKIIETNTNNSLMLVTALNQEIGYDNTAKVAKNAFDKNITLKESVLDLGLLSEKKFDEIVIPKNMTHP